MATRLPAENILGVFKSIKDEAYESLLRPRGSSMKSCGTKDLGLSVATDLASGYWENPAEVSSKPPRWIVQLVTDANGTATARLAINPAGEPYGMARTLGYVNNRDGTCATAVFRALMAVRPHGAEGWEFPAGWECLFLIGFSPALPQGTSGDPLTNFRPQEGEVEYGGGEAKRAFPIAFRAVVMAPSATGTVPALSYRDAAAALATMTGAELYDGSVDAERDRLIQDLRQAIATEVVGERFVLEEDTNLVGMDPIVYRQIEAAINSGKRHIILYGPPGTGKTTLAEYLAREVSERDGGEGSYVMLTASSAWSTQDLVGGYQPLGPGKIGFIPGALLRNFDKPTVIDELNRCPIDKVLGPLFSILSGQASTLPCRVDVTRPESPFYVVLPAPRANLAEHERAPTKEWRLICTLNTYDKTQLGQISYALSRRFAWIKVGAPSDADAFVRELAARAGAPASPAPPANPIAEMWQAVNGTREIGGAPIVDMIGTLRALDPAIDLFANPTAATAELFMAAFRMCILPLMDGLSEREATGLAASIATSWSLGETPAERLLRDCLEFST